MAIFGPIILLIMLGVVVSLTLFLVEWMLFPLKAGVIEPKNKKQFFLSDMYVLMLQLAFPGLLLTTDIARRDSNMLVVVAGLCSLFILLWFIGISMLSRAGVTRAWPRAVSLCIAIPGAYVGSFAACGVAAFSLFTQPVLIPILFVGVILLYGICNSIAEWAINSKYAVHSER